MIVCMCQVYNVNEKMKLDIIYKKKKRGSQFLAPSWPRSSLLNKIIIIIFFLISKTIIIKRSMFDHCHPFRILGRNSNPLT